MSDESQRMWKLAGQYSAVGIEMVAAVLIGGLGGDWLDRQLHTEPWFSYLGLVVGIGAASLTVVRIVRRTRLDRL